ncbi:MAG: helix-turn-helix domain-containing protein [Desulfitobacteriaceae bacterium]
MNSPDKSVGRRIVHYRNQKGLSQQELAALAGIRSKRLDDIETGKTKPHLPVAALLAWALDISLKELLEMGEKRVED